MPFQAVFKPKPNFKLLWSITTDADNPVNQSELKENTVGGTEARENVCK